MYPFPNLRGFASYRGHFCRLFACLVDIIDILYDQNTLFDIHLVQTKSYTNVEIIVVILSFVKVS